VYGTVFAINRDGRITMNNTRALALPLLSLVFILVTVSAAPAADRIQAEKLFVEAQKALSRGENDRAESLLKKALAEDPSFTSSIWQLAQIYEKRGSLEYARELIIRGLQQEPQATWARDKLAQLEGVLTQKLLREAKSYMKSGEYNLAIPKLSLYLGIKPYDAVPLVMIGRCHLALGNPETAKEYLDQAAERDPSNPEVSNLIAEAEKRIRQIRTNELVEGASSILADYTPERRDEALRALEKVLGIDPGNAWAKERLSELESVQSEQTPEIPSVSVDAKNEGTGPLGFIPPMVLVYVSISLLAALIALIVVTGRRKTDKSSHPLSGSLALIPIIDIVALLHGNLKTGRLVLRTPKGKGEICFEKGEIIHARWKGIDGKKAFNRIMEQRSGTYFYFNKLPNTKHTIDEPLSVLLLSMNRAEASVSDLHEKSARESEEFIASSSR
jgi:tetratricopeptide (TPR) repeat protein